MRIIPFECRIIKVYKLISMDMLQKFLTQSRLRISGILLWSILLKHCL